MFCKTQLLNYIFHTLFIKRQIYNLHLNHITPQSGKPFESPSHHNLSVNYRVVHSQLDCFFHLLSTHCLILAEEVFAVPIFVK